MKYFKPKSMTWWSGLVAVLVPVLGFLGVDINPKVGELVQEAAIGTGLIGLRGAASSLLGK